jgi:hypothetical protein
MKRKILIYTLLASVALGITTFAQRTATLCASCCYTNEQGITEQPQQRDVKCLIVHVNEVLLQRGAATVCDDQMYARLLDFADILREAAALQDSKNNYNRSQTIIIATASPQHLGSDRFVVHFAHAEYAALVDALLYFTRIPYYLLEVGEVLPRLSLLNTSTVVKT